MIGMDWKRIVLSGKTYAALFGGLLLLLHPISENLEQLPGVSPIYLINMCLGASDFTPFAALLCVLPFADSFCVDYNTGFLKYSVLRTGKRKYVFVRTLDVALSGGLLMFLIMAAMFTLCTLLAGSGITPQEAEIYEGTIWWKMNAVLPYNGLFMYIGKCFCAFLFGSVWALWGLAVSVFVTDRYVTTVVPFAFYQIHWYFFKHSLFNPVFLLRGDDRRIPSLLFIVAVQGSIIAALSVISILKMVRRAEQ